MEQNNFDHDFDKMSNDDFRELIDSYSDEDLNYFAKNYKFGMPCDKIEILLSNERIDKENLANNDSEIRSIVRGIFGAYSDYKYLKSGGTLDDLSWNQEALTILLKNDYLTQDDFNYFFNTSFGGVKIQLGQMLSTQESGHQNELEIKRALLESKFMNETCFEIIINRLSESDFHELSELIDIFQNKINQTPYSL